MSENLERENEVFGVMVSKAASSCLDVASKDFKLSSLLLPAVGHVMFTMFVVLRLVATLMKLLKEDQKHAGLLQIYEAELQRVLGK